MKQYLKQLDYILSIGTEKSDRTGTGTLSVFGLQERYDLRKGFPLVTTKKIHWKSVVYELLWFLSGRNDVKWLQDKGVSIWDEFQLEDGTIGRGYGTQWREWDYTRHAGVRLFRSKSDQITNLIEDIKTNPTSRRHIVSAWNVGELNQMALPPCHMMFQVNVVPFPITNSVVTRGRDGTDPNKGYIDLQMYQRSADMFLGVPFNIASYSLLLMMIAKVTGYTARHFIHTIGDAHIYKNHIPQVKEQLGRKPMKLPEVNIVHVSDNYLSSGMDYNLLIQTPDDFIWKEAVDLIHLLGYNHHPTIKAPIAV